VGAIALSGYPVLVELIHNDVVEGTIIDDYGIPYDFFLIRQLHILNRTAQRWSCSATSGNRSYSATIQPGMDVTLSIPPGQRFNSAPLLFTLSFTPDPG